MPLILPELGEALANTAAIMSILNGQQTSGQLAAMQEQLDAIQLKVNLIYSVATDPTIGNTAIINAINTLNAQLSLDVTAIITAIGTPTQTGVPVDITTGASTGVAADVWNYDVSGGVPVYAFTVMQRMWVLAGLICNSPNVPYYYNTFFTLAPADEDWVDPGTFSPVPTPSFSDMSGAATLADWLALDTSGLTWGISNLDGYTYSAPSTGPSGTWYCVLTEPMFQAIKAGSFSTPAEGLSLWPGLANVTLGTPVAISAGVTITAPMDGCLVEITGVPAKQGFYSFDTAVSWRNVGALAFTSDNGDEEFPQQLGFTNAVYCPKTMEHAAGLVLRATGGVTGTITPWQRI